MSDQPNNTNNQTNNTQVTSTSEQVNNNSTTQGTTVQPSPNWEPTERQISIKNSRTQNNVDIDTQ